MILRKISFERPSAYEDADYILHAHSLSDYSESGLWLYSSAITMTLSSGAKITVSDFFGLVRTP
jgi:hypothetical protein